jgi:HPr kinase/phosphorylase
MVIIITWNLTVDRKIISLAEKYNVPIYRTSEMTSEFIAGLTQTRSVALAKRITRHGVLVEVYGEGVLLYGDSGVGKSEVAMELIKRGHRLIADDAVEIRRVSNRSLVGTSPENIRHFMELRGVGIINARNLFGMGAVKKSAKLDMIINLEPWDNDKVYDRMGAEDVYTKVLDVEVPFYTIPVQPGRNIAVIVEVAAMNNRQKRMGNNAALELMERISMPSWDYDDDLGEWDSYYGLDE